MSIKRNVVLAVCFSSAAVVCAQETSEVSALTGRLQNYETFKADFNQVVTDSEGRIVQESSGDLRAKRDGLFYWHVEPPLEQYIAADGEEVEVYDPDLQQVTIYPMDEKLTATPALLLSGDVDGLQDAYEVTRIDKGAANPEFRLEPKDPDSLFLSLTLVFGEKALEEMRLKDSLGQSSVLRFSNIVINEPVAQDVFELEYPSSVDVIRNQAAP